MSGPEWLRQARAELEEPQAETRAGRAWERVLCPRGIHGPRRKQEHKFNGGNTCWLCPYCRRIIRYDASRRARVLSWLFLESRWGWLGNPLLWWCSQCGDGTYHAGLPALSRFRAAHAKWLWHR